MSGSDSGGAAAAAAVKERQQHRWWVRGSNGSGAAEMAVELVSKVWISCEPHIVPIPTYVGPQNLNNDLQELLNTESNADRQAICFGGGLIFHRQGEDQALICGRVTPRVAVGQCFQLLYQGFSFKKRPAWCYNNLADNLLTTLVAYDHPIIV